MDFILIGTVPFFEISVSVVATLLNVVLAAAVVPSSIVLVLWIGYQWTNRRIIAAARKVPELVPTVPFIGNANLLFNGYNKMTNTLIRAAQEVTSFGATVVSIWIGPCPIFLITAANDVKLLLSKSKTEKSFESEIMKFAIGNALVVAKEHTQKITRRFINPVFQPRNLGQFVGGFNESSRHLVRSLSGLVDKGQVDVSGHVTPVVFKNIACVIFGPDIDINVESGEFLGLIEMSKVVGRIAVNRFFKLWLWVNAIFELLWKEDIIQVETYWRGFANGPLKKLEQKRKIDYSKGQNKNYSLQEESTVQISGENNNNTNTEIITFPEAYKVLMDTFPNFTHNDMECEMKGLVMAGAETSRITISSCLLSLAADSTIQDKLYQEIVSVLGRTDEDVTIQHLQKMPYLDQVLKETHRRFCVIPVLIRETKADVQLSEYMIPKGARVVLSNVSMHFDPAVFPDPFKFDPDRFLPENANKIKKHEYIPFGYGIRSCIGSTYATMLIKIVIIHVLRRYRLTTTVDISNLTYKIGIAMIADKGYQIELNHR